jgi:hypothetical protein
MESSDYLATPILEILVRCCQGYNAGLEGRLPEVAVWDGVAGKGDLRPCFKDLWRRALGSDGLCIYIRVALVGAYGPNVKAWIRYPLVVKLCSA